MYYNFNKLYIVESLQEGDLKTGKIIYEDIFKWHKENGKAISTELHQIKNIYGLELLFDIIIQESKSSFIRPILHFETHGNEEGILLSSGELYNWKKLVERIAELNLYTQNYLFLILALCKGGYLLSAIEKFITRRAPFFAVIYSFNTVITAELLRGFKKYYLEIFNSKNVAVAMDMLNSEISVDISKFILHSCAYIFKFSFESFLTFETSRKIVNQRTESILSQAKKAIPSIDLSSARKIIKLQLKKENQEEYFTEMRDIYFMSDIYPDNNKRIELKYSDLYK